MNHRFHKLTVALGILALGVLMATAPAQASNMGFKLERTLTFHNGFFNYYYLSLPFFRSVPDWDGDTNETSADLLIDLWQKSHNPLPADIQTLGSMTISGFDNEPGGEFPTAAGIDNSFYGEQVFPTGPNPTDYLFASNLPAGDPNFPSQHFFIDEVHTPGWRGYQIQLGGDPNQATPPDITHNVVIVGSHNPAVTQATMNIVNTPVQYFNLYEVSVPYHTTWTEAQDVLCAAWVASVPGATDCTAPDASLTITMSTFDNVQGSPTANTFIGKQIYSFGGAPAFAGNVATLPVVPGDGYEFQLGSDGTTISTVKLPFPHY